MNDGEICIIAEKYTAELHGFSVEGTDSFINPVGKHKVTTVKQKQI